MVMATKMLEATVRQHGPVAVIEMRGEIDSFGEEALNAAYAEVEERKPSAVLLNFAGVDYINSTGIALVVRLLADARRDGRGVRAVGLTPHYREIFRITRLSDFMDIVEGDAA
jgi:anti-sigma B factor antagonist